MMRWTLKLASRRRATVPKGLLEALRLGPGDVLALLEDTDGRFHLQVKRLSSEGLAPLRDLIRPGTPDFDIGAFREGAYDPALRS